MMSDLGKVLCFFLLSNIYLMMKGNLTPSFDRITSAMMPGNMTYDYSVVITPLLHEYSVLMGHTTPLVGLHLYLNYTHVKFYIQMDVCYIQALANTHC